MCERDSVDWLYLHKLGLLFLIHLFSNKTRRQGTLSLPVYVPFDFSTENSSSVMKPADTEETSSALTPHGNHGDSGVSLTTGGSGEGTDTGTAEASALTDPGSGFRPLCESLCGHLFFFFFFLAKHIIVGRLFRNIHPSLQYFSHSRIHTSLYDFFPCMCIPHYASSPSLQCAQFSFLSFSQSLLNISEPELIFKYHGQWKEGVSFVVVVFCTYLYTFSLLI